MSEEKKRINVDFDKTLTTGEGAAYWEEGEDDPDEEMVEWVNEQYKSGHTIVIWTARPWSTAQQTVGMLTKWGVMWHGIRMEKGSADVYIDDKTVRPEEVGGNGYD
jgi:hypothetical protein